VRDDFLTTARPFSGSPQLQDGPLLSLIHLREYSDFGFTIVPGVITAEEAQKLRHESQQLLAEPSIHSRVYRSDDVPGRFLVDILMSTRSQLFLQLAMDPRVLRVAAHFIGESRFSFFYDQLFYKEAGAGARTQWHQDLPFWPLQGDRIPSVWIALNAVDEHGSAVQYLPGSHRTGEIFVAVDPGERRAARAAGLNVCPDPHLDARRAQLKSHRLQPGDAIVHHPLVVHGAGPNHSSTDRLAVSLRYCASDTIWAPRANTMHFPRANAIAAGTPVGEIPMFLACAVPEALQPTT
jgi:ectoine hydroxylase-related dioxygenase (phytanoyl-CoA dioxygenase family)